MWLVECGQAIDRQTLPHVRPPAVTKSPNFWAGTSPPPPANKQHSFQYTVISHIKSCMAHSGPRQKARLFVTEGIMAKKAQIQQARPLRMLVEWASIFISYIPASFHLMDTEP